MNVAVCWLSYDENTPSRDYWDQGMIEDMFSGQLWRVPNPYQFYHCTSLDEVKERGAIIVFPARAQVRYVERLNRDMERFDWVILMLTGDEEASFEVERIRHRNVRIWVMSPRPDRHAGMSYLGTGYPKHARELIKQCEYEYQNKSLDFFFAGQITHERRKDMAEQLKHMSDRPDMKGEYLETKGFTQGMEHMEYYKKLSSAKTAPCPSGPETPDSFRLFEALECGVIPIADTRTPKGTFPDDYWQQFFGGDVPFPVLTVYDQLPGYTLAALEDWKALSNKVFAWWMAKKRDMAYALDAQINRCVSKRESEDSRERITVIIATSPIKDHPSTEGLERTIADVRKHLPNSEIIITFDGVRKEQEHYRERYEEYKRRAIWKCHHQWSNVLPVVFDEHMHQARMMRAVLGSIRTPLFIYVEHDAPLVPDAEFEWDGLVKAVTTGQAHVIRFHHEAHVLPDHEHMMIGDVEEVCGIKMRRTRQWSQRPHLTSVAFYLQMLENYFNPESRTMIEDVIHGVVDEQCRLGGIMAWYNWRLWIYHPDGGNIKRSYHIDGRGSDEKFEMEILPVKKGGKR